MNYQDCLSIGKIVKPIGLKGLVKVISLSDFPERFHECESVYLFDEKQKAFLKNKSDGSLQYKIRECSSSGSFLRIGFEGFDRIEDTAKLIGTIVMIDEKERVELKEGQYYYYELIGLEVFEKDELLGKVESVVDYGSGDLFRLVLSGKELLIPFRDEFVKKIDLKEKRIDVELIEGFH